ncbi:MAG: type II toxin-antitoxin system RelE/ParE family toxin [Rhodanobacteraceae bacterium]
MLHPAATLEHEEQVAYYEARSSGLGRRYHTAFRSALLHVCEAPHRYKVVQAPGIRIVSLHGFPFSLIYREVHGQVVVLAVALHRKRPGYWAGRL